MGEGERGIFNLNMALTIRDKGEHSLNSQG